MARKSFILYLTQKGMFDTLNDTQAGKLIKAIFEYEQTNEMPKLNGQANIAFMAIKPLLDENKDRYDKVCEKNKLNGKRGGRPKKEETQKNPKNPSGYFGNPKNLNIDIDNDIDIDIDIDNSSSSSSNNNNNKASESCVDGLQEVINFYNDNVGLITPYRFRNI
jgi:hypothetical protein